ncbi:branched-chain amino acid transport system II carrier protein [Arcanobacterium phocisimile]|uniref:Branched-chain amino acid transport system II carrier protein n=1 Tax=Arcanobacterium phocisimile TaxID=1302235 RepID=A0ABX7IFL1_9ACTO|nr:branched-chain amino acid transport system II carrier protein [Arcanobacterium phocisimile]QRV01645.1 branched-chain amino acid transport system II carrier protein [Arcanobacterium phocisimile]
MFSQSSRSILFSGFALFAMFFGAGNLIFPPMIGVNAGESAYPAIAGFLVTGVALTVLGMIAAGTLRKNEVRIADRVGRRFGAVFTTVLFLVIAMLYATPRVATVSFEMGVVPFAGDGQIVLVVYTAVFFAICYALILQPAKIIERIGAYLTPALLVLLVIMSLSSYLLPNLNHAANESYAQSPFATGLIEGYFTMDSLAALMFAPVILGALASAGFVGKKLYGGMVKASVLAGVLLALTYLGLVNIGIVGDGDNGAAVITNVSHELFGRPGQMIFGLIVFLACLTTALGLMTASVAYFSKLVPQLSSHTWLIIHVVVAFGLSNLGLDIILMLVAPLTQLLYPITIAVIVVALVEAFAVRCYLTWSYRLAAYTAAALAIPEALNATGISAFSSFRFFLDLFPLGYLQMAWLVPALVALVLGLAIDMILKPATLAQEA